MKWTTAQANPETRVDRIRSRRESVGVRGPPSGEDLMRVEF